MAVFPAEILFMVFSYLSFRDLIRCHRVSRQWRAITVSDPSLYQYIDLSVGKELTAPNIKALVRYAGGAVKGLKMFPPECTFTPGCFQLISHTHGDTTFKTHRNVLLEPLFRQLEEFEFKDNLFINTFGPNMMSLPCFPSRNLRRLLVESLCYLKDLEYICTAAPLLEHLSCRLYLHERMDDSLRFHSLKTFHITTQGPLRPAFQSLLGWYPNVEDFAFYEQTNYQSSTDEVIYDWENLKVMTVRQTTAPNLSITSNKLTTLDLAKSGYLTVCDIPAQPNLQHLHIRDLPNLPIHPSLTPLLSSGPTLESLTISSPQFEVRDIENLLREAVNLRSLNIDNLRYTNDATLQLLHAHQRLQVLSVNHCTGITGHGIIQLIEKLRVKKGGKLTAISVRGNESIRRQTIDWALEMGVKVSI
jgi:F-box-like